MSTVDKQKDEDVNCEDQDLDRSGPDEHDKAGAGRSEQAGDSTTKSDR